MEKEPKKKNLVRRIGRIVLKTFLWIFLLIIVLFLLILTPPVQQFICNKATNWLEKKTATRVDIKRLYITLTGKIAVDGLYIEDRSKDTLFAADELRVNMSFYKILFGNELDIKSVRLDGATAKIKRALPDTAFNFQFIVDAFSSGSPDTVQVSDTSAGMAIDIRSVEINNTRLVYKDVVSGSDVEAVIGHFDTKIDKFDLEKLAFDIPRTAINNMTAKVILRKPLTIPAPEKLVTDTSSSSASLQLLFDKILVEQTSIDYRDSVNLLYANAAIGELDLRPRKIDLQNGVFDLGDLSLSSTTASVQMGKKEASTPVIVKSPALDTMIADEQGIHLSVASLGIKDVRLNYNNDNDPVLKKGMDYSHINAAIANFQVKDFLFNKDTIRGGIKKAALKEQSGFVLEELTTDFLYTTNQAYLKDLYLKTPGTELKRAIAIRFASAEAMAKDIANLAIEADINESKVQVKDVLTFVPSLQQQPAFADANATWFLDGKISGRVGDLQIDNLQLSGLSNTKVDINGSIKGLPDSDKLFADLRIHQLSSSQKDVLAFMPAGSMPQSISLPNSFNLTGTIKGGTAHLATDLRLQTDKGNATVNGTMQHITNAKQASYDIAISTQQLNLASILKDTSYGPVTMAITAKGRGYDLKTANAVINGKINSAVYKGYNYKDLALNAGVANQQLTAKASILDPNIHFALDGSADLSKAAPAVKMVLQVDSIKTRELNLTPETLIYRGTVTADFAVADPDSLMGKLFITNSLLVQKNERIKMDTIQLWAGIDTGKHFLQFNSDIAYGRLQGQYKLTQLPDVFMQVIEPYYSINSTPAGKKPATKPDPYDFTLAATVVDKPLLHSLVPGLEKMEGVSLQSRFSSAQGMNATLLAKDILLGSNRIQGLQLTAATSDTTLNIKAVTKQFSSGTSIMVDSTILTAKLGGNKIDFDLAIKDKAAKDKYDIAGQLQQSPNGDLVFALQPDGLLLNYDKWQVAPDNRILISNAGGINASNFTLQRLGQQLKLNSESAAANAPMNITFTDFKLSTITAMVMADSVLVNGNLTGEVILKDLTGNPMFTGDLLINDLSYKNDTIGNVQAKVNNSTANVYAADITLSGRGNDAVIKGTYNAAASSFDMNMDLTKLPMKTAEAFAGGSIKDATGFLSGKFNITGTPSQPKVNGDLNFNQTRFNVAMLNSYFAIDNEKISVNEQGIQFNRFQVKDSSGNDLSLDGTLATTNFVNYKFDLDVRANNFKALSSTKKDNKLFYGQLYFNTNLKIKGTEAAPAIDGRLTVNDKTKMTVVLPQSDPGVVEREGVIEFVDMDAPLNDSLFMLAYDSLNTSSFTGMDVSLNVEIDKGADFTLIIDEGNGDFLNVKGEAQLTAGIDPSGKITMVGTYELEQGAYELSFNMIRKKFDIQKGSKIVWEGEPTSANVDITAKYVANTAPLDLVKGQLDENISAQERNTYLQRLPFDVNLKMQGELLKPQITFDIVLPENQNYGVSNDILTNVRTKLEQLRQSTGDMNKQVFSLLLLNRFVAENPFNSSTSLSTNTLIRQSVTKLLTEQLNRLAEGLIEGVDINLGVESSEDYTSGEKQEKTDLNVGLSKRLLNDRLTVTVGSNFALEGAQNTNQQSNNIAGNVAIDYALSSDGRYKIRAYRKNDYQGVIDGYVVETGVGFIITLDYNKFNQIFRSKKKQEELRRQRREQRQKEQEQKNPGQQKATEEQPDKKNNTPVTKPAEPARKEDNDE